jgi:hypothetical protein
MVHPFISSPSRGTLTARFGGVSLSVVVHTTLIAGAVVATLPPLPDFLASAGDYARPRIEQVRFIRTVPPEPRRDADKDGSPRETNELAALMLVAPTITPIAAPEIGMAETPDLDLEAEMNDWLTRQLESGASVASALAEAMRRMYAAPVNGAYQEDVVEKTVWPRPNNPRPSYPSSLLLAGVEAHVLARFIVDSTGRVSERSMIFPEGAHRMFVDAIKRSLLRSRYFPAELAGRRVSQHVIQEFVFRIDR